MTSVKLRRSLTDSRTNSVSSRLSNCRRKAPVEAGVVSVAGAGRDSRTTGDSPARAAQKAVEAPTTPAPMTASSTPAGRVPSGNNAITGKIARLSNPTK